MQRVPEPLRNFVREQADDGAFVGILAWGGGIKFQAVVANSGEPESGAISADPPSIEILWQPAPDELQGMVRV